MDTGRALKGSVRAEGQPVRVQQEGQVSSQEALGGSSPAEAPLSLASSLRAVGR